MTVRTLAMKHRWLSLDHARISGRVPEAMERGTGIGLSSRNETALRSEQVWPGSNRRPVSPGRIRSSGPHPRPDRPRRRPRPGAFLDGLAEGLVRAGAHEDNQPGHARWPGPRPIASRGRLH
jgi:hypothetical protein